jgi:hypothetical protein
MLLSRQELSGKIRNQMEPLTKRIYDSSIGVDDATPLTYCGVPAVDVGRRPSVSSAACKPAAASKGQAENWPLRS